MTRRALVARGIAAGAALSLASAPPAGATGPIVAYRRLYAAINGSLVIYSVPFWRVLKTIPLPTADGPRGIVCHIGIGSLWITHGLDDGTGGSLLRFDIASNTVLWDRALGTGVDQPAISLDGLRLYVPTGEKSPTDLWHIVDPRTGALTGRLAGPAGPHNTIARQHHVYLGGVGSHYVHLNNGFTIGPLVNGCRPFTVDAAEQLIYTTASYTRGFQVSSVTTGRVLATVNFGAVPRGFPVSSPSHGISLSPKGAEVWVLDTPAQRIRVYTSGASPAHLIDIPIDPIMGTDKPATAYDNLKAGWVLHSRRGDYVYVGDSGSVISTATRKRVAYLDALANGRHGIVEVEFDATNVAVATSTHYGMSY
jgi:hypothetical protein